MMAKHKLYFSVFILSALMGVAIFGFSHFSSANYAYSGGSLIAQQVNIIHADLSPAIQMAIGAEQSPGLWMNPYGHNGTIQMGLHENGFPFALVSDSAIRNFGLGRVDGKNASPILVFRSKDIVKMVFGLNMVQVGQQPFLTYYSADDKKHDFIGNYCEDPSRVCR